MTDPNYGNEPQEFYMSWDDDPKYLKNDAKHDWGVGAYFKRAGTADDEGGFFAFTKAFYNERFYEESPQLSNESAQIIARCDASAPKQMPVPADIHETDEETGICLACGSTKPVYPTTRNHIASLSNLRILRAPFQGYKGFIIYSQMYDSEKEKAVFDEAQNTAPTLQELFKLMLEWDWVYTNLEVRDIHATLAHEMLEEFNMPQQIRDWIWDSVPDMRVAKFFKNDINARQRAETDSIPDMSDDFDAWCWHRIVRTEAIYPYLPR